MAWALGLCLGLCAGGVACAAPAPQENPTAPAGDSAVKESAVQIRLIIDGTTLNATLADNAAARDFAALLPLELTLRDYANTEKVADLPRKLDLSGTPPGYAAVAGDLTHYAPWGNLAIFYRPFRYADGLVKLGHIDGDLAALTRKTGPSKARIERAR